MTEAAGVRLDTALSSQNGHRTVQNAQRTLNLNSEVNVARGVDDVDAVTILLECNRVLLSLRVAPVASGSCGGDGDTTLLLLDHPVHGSAAVVNLADLVVDAGVVQNTLGSGGLTSIDVGHNADISRHLKRNFSGSSHEINLLQNRSITEMSESLVGLGHLVGILALLHGVAGVVGSVHDLSSQALGHGLLTTAAAVSSQPAQAQSLAASGLIVPKFQKLAKSRNQERYYVRGTFTRDNLDFSNDILHFADLGFKQMSIEPVVGDESDPYAIREEDIPMINEEYDKLAKIMIEREKEGKGFNFFHFMIDLDGGPCVAKRLSGCGSGTEYLAVTPWGDLYPCHQFVGQEEFLMGNVDEGIVRPEIADDFRSCNVYSKDKCRDCFAKFYCSGGCMANSYNFHGTIHDTYDIGCEMQRKRVECAIMMKAALAEE